MAVFPEHFDQEKYWLLSTLNRETLAIGDPERTIKGYEMAWCSIPNGGLCLEGRDHKGGVLYAACWPGASWSFRDLLDLLETPDIPQGWSEARNIANLWKRMNLEWFRPVLRKLASGEPVAFAEVNELHRKAHEGKPLRLYPFLAPMDALEYWKMELDYEY